MTRTRTSTTTNRASCRCQLCSAPRLRKQYGRVERRGPQRDNAVRRGLVEMVCRMCTRCCSGRLHSVERQCTVEDSVQSRCRGLYMGERGVVLCVCCVYLDINNAAWTSGSMTLRLSCSHILTLAASRSLWYAVRGMMRGGKEGRGGWKENNTCLGIFSTSATQGEASSGGAQTARRGDRVPCTDPGYYPARRDPSSCPYRPTPSTPSCPLVRSLPLQKIATL